MNTPTEYMYQMATVAYHTLHDTETVVLTEPAEYEGQTFPAGEYEFAVDGLDWTGFDRLHPIEGPAREMAWTGNGTRADRQPRRRHGDGVDAPHGLWAAALFGAIGFTVLIAGLGLVWATRAVEEKAPRKVAVAQPMPA